MAKNSRQFRDLPRLLSLAHQRLSWGLPVVAVLGLLVILTWPRPPAEALIRAGDQAFAQGHLQGAFSSYQRALLLQPKNMQVHVKLAAIYERSNRFDQAINELTTAQAINPSANLQTETARIAALRDEPLKLQTEAAQLVAILAAYPSYRDAWIKLGFLYYRLREDVLAKKAVEAALNLDPNNETALRLKSLLP